MKHAEALVAQGGGLGILVVDIVHFRSINELYGEPTGDAVLTAIAERIDRIRWPDLITARFGGDEFVLAVRASNQSSLEALRDRVKRDVSQPFMAFGSDSRIVPSSTMASSLGLGRVFSSNAGTLVTR